MIHNLRATTDQNTEHDWLKTNLARFTSMMQGQRDLTTVGQMLLSELAPLVSAQYGAVYQMEGSNGDSHLKMLAGYARTGDQKPKTELPVGVGLVGQCAVEKRRILLSDVPPNYIRIGSGLGEGRPRSLIVLPVIFEGQTKAVVELASLAEFTSTHLTFLSQLTESIGIVLNTIEATMRTEGLLQQSQKLASELQTQQRELQQTNDELGHKAQQLAENAEGNLTAKQVEFSRNVHAAGADLLNLISDILDLSKIESGTVTVEPEEVLFPKVREAVERSFRHMAEARHLHFEVEMDPKLPLSMNTDLKRLQ